MKTAIITGASRGIGKETARLFAEKGYRLSLCYNNSEEEAKKLYDELSLKTDVLLMKTDVTDKAMTDYLAKETIKRYGKIDVLINNAGISFPPTLFTDTEKEERDRIFGVNLFGTFNMTQSVLPFMIHEKKGSIINISSIWGISGASCEVLYSSSKAAVIGFTKALSKEVSLSGIRVNCVAPGVIDTEMNAHLSFDERASLMEEIPFKRFGTPREVSSLIQYLASDDSSYITGQTITIDGGFIG